MREPRKVVDQDPRPLVIIGGVVLVGEERLRAAAVLRLIDERVLLGTGVAAQVVEAAGVEEPGPGREQPVVRVVAEVG